MCVAMLAISKRTIATIVPFYTVVVRVFASLIILWLVLLVMLPLLRLPDSVCVVYRAEWLFSRCCLIIVFGWCSAVIVIVVVVAVLAFCIHGIQSAINVCAHHRANTPNMPYVVHSRRIISGKWFAYNSI